MAKSRSHSETRRPFPEDETSPYGLFAITFLNQAGEAEPIFSDQLGTLVNKVVQRAGEIRTGAQSDDLVLTNRRGTEIFSSQLIVRYPFLRRMVNLMMVKHAGQIRKGDGADYREHPLEVAHILAHFNFGAEVIAGGLGHDLLEDTEATKEEILAASTPEVLRIIRAVSDDRSQTDWWQRKLAHIESIRRGGGKPVAVMVADHISNLRAALDTSSKEGEQFWLKFNAAKSDKLRYEQKALNLAMNTVKTPEMAAMVTEFAGLVGQLAKIVGNR